MKKIFIILFFLASSSIYASTPNYFLSLTLDTDYHKIYGDQQITFTNTSEKALKTVELVLYPNRYLKLPKQINEVNFEWIYPHDFNKGEIELKNILIKKGSKEYSPQSEFTDNKQIIRLFLQKPLAPDDKITITFDFITSIPEMYGAFGYYKDTVTLLGNFYPYLLHLTMDGKWDKKLPPESSYFTLKLKVPPTYKFLVNGKYFEKAKAIRYENEVPYLTLIGSPQINVNKFEMSPFNISYYQLGKSKGHFKLIKKSLTNIINFFNSLKILPPKNNIIIADSRMRHLLTFNAPNTIFISDRILEIFFYFRYLHDFILARAFFEEVFRDKFFENEEYEDACWISEVLSAYLMKTYKEDFFTRTGRPLDARDTWIFRYFSFFPPVFESIYAPQFPFVYAYYNKIYFMDRFRQNIFDYHREVPNGRVITEKLFDILPRESFDILFGKFLNAITQDNPIDFQIYANTFLKDKNKHFFLDWLSPLPRINYSFGEIKRRKIAGKWETWINVKRKSNKEVFEPVTLLAKERLGKKHYLKWESKGDSHTFFLETKKKISLLQIDPYRRLNEYKLRDNRNPSKHVLVLEEFTLAAEVFQGEVDGSVFFSLRREFNPKHLWNFYSFYNPNSYGGSFGYGHQFGRLVDALRLYHYGYIDYVFNKLNAGDVTVTSDVTSEEHTVPKDSGYTTSILLGYSFGTTLSYKNPHSGWRMGASTELSNKYLGSLDYHFYKASIGAVKLWRVASEHILGLRARIGTSFMDVPTQRHFSLGGVHNIRGLPSSAAEFMGRNRFIMSGEYRHPIFRNLNINFWNLFRIRKIQGAINVNSGRVTGTVHNKWQNEIHPDDIPIDNNFWKIFDVTNFSADFGYSIGIFIDAFNIRETLLRFDVAKQIDDFMERAPTFYISLDQGF